MDQGNMYLHSKLQWNVGVGCDHQCKYCEDSFQRQMKRQKHNCTKCYTFTPHFHPERLNIKLPETKGPQFIWPFSSADIAFMKEEWVRQVLQKIREHRDKTFFFQTKDPQSLKKYSFPANVILGITLETNDNEMYKQKKISKAPSPTKRAKIFADIDHRRKVITIEPIMEFDTVKMLELCSQIDPVRIYMGYDTKNSKVPEPTYHEFQTLIKALEETLPNTIIYTKFQKEDYWKNQWRLDKWITT